MAWRWRLRYLRPLFRGGPNLFKHGASVTFGGHSPHYTTRSAGSTVSLRVAPGLVGVQPPATDRRRHQFKRRALGAGRDRGAGDAVALIQTCSARSPSARRWRAFYVTDTTLGEHLQLVRRDGEHISVLSSLRAHAAPKRTLAMGIFEPLIERSHYKQPEPRHRRDVVALILLALLAVWLLAVVLLVWGG